jgi:hypothetical protein
MPNPFPPELRWLYVRIKPFLRWHALSFLSFSSGSLLALSQPLLMKWKTDKVLPERNAYSSSRTNRIGTRTFLIPIIAFDPSYRIEETLRFERQC